MKNRSAVTRFITTALLASWSCRQPYANLASLCKAETPSDAGAAAFLSSYLARSRLKLSPPRERCVIWPYENKVATLSRDNEPRDLLASRTTELASTAVDLVAVSDSARKRIAEMLPPGKNRSYVRRRFIMSSQKAGAVKSARTVVSSPMSRSVFCIISTQGEQFPSKNDALKRCVSFCRFSYLAVMFRRVFQTCRKFSDQR